MNRLLFAALTLGALSLCMCGCSKSSSGAEYVPFPPNATWEYSFDFTAPLYGLRQGVNTIRCEGTEVIGGKTYFKTVAVLTGIPNTQPQTQYYRIGDDAVYLRASKDSDHEDVYLPLPPKVGKSWIMDNAQGKGTMKIEQSGAVTLPERTYENVLQVSMTFEQAGKKGSGQMYFAPNIGLIRQVVNMEGITIESRLKVFQKDGAPPTSAPAASQPG